MKKRTAWTRIGVSILMLCYSQGFSQRHDDSLRQSRHEIVLLNLINGLYLSQEQSVQIIEKIKEAERIRDEFQHKIEKKQTEFSAVLTQLKEILWNQKEVPDDLKHHIHSMERDFHQLQDQQGEALIAMEKEVQEILTQNQCIVIDQFKPCLISPAQGRIGQSVDVAAQGIVRMFERIRRIKKSQYDKMQDVCIDQYLNRIERHIGQLEEAERESLEEEARTVISEVREMPDDIFLIQKQNLAEQLIKKSEENRRLCKNELGKVGKYLLDPTTLPILKARI